MFSGRFFMDAFLLKAFARGESRFLLLYVTNTVKGPVLPDSAVFSGPVFRPEKRYFRGFSSWHFFMPFLCVSVRKLYPFFLPGLHSGRIVFFLADWFDNGLVFHLSGSRVLPVPAVWGLFDVNGTGGRNGWRV